jgi:hypothetical protein
MKPIESQYSIRGFVFHHSSKTCSLETFQRAGLSGLRSLAHTRKYDKEREGSLRLENRSVL